MRLRAGLRMGLIVGLRLRSLSLSLSLLLLLLLLLLLGLLLGLGLRGVRLVRRHAVHVHMSCMRHAHTVHTHTPAGSP